MLNPKELRIGNYLQFHLLFTNSNHVKAIDYLDIRDIAENRLLIAEPIEIREEWLKRLGFDYSCGSYLKKTGEQLISISLGDKKFRLWPEGKGDSSYSGGIEYVHQLQNLYFALTGEELKLVETPIQA